LKIVSCGNFVKEVIAVLGVPLDSPKDIASWQRRTYFFKRKELHKQHAVEGRRPSLYVILEIPQQVAVLMHK
jgi:hypothetical protein